MRGTTAHVEQDLAAFAVGALDAPDRERVRTHLAACGRCRASLEGYQEVADGLLHVLPARRPPESLRKRIRKSLPPAAQQVERPARWRMELVYPVLTGLLTVAVLGLSLTAWQIRGTLLQSQRNMERLEADMAERSRVDGVALALLSYPNRQVSMISGDKAYGTVVYEPRIPLVIMNAWGLPDLQAGQTFQGWLVRANGDRVSGGLFLRDSGSPFTRVLLEASEPVSNFVGVGVTVEPEGGSEWPSGPNVCSADF
jgi:anti-sigma-K factor RskA